MTSDEERGDPGADAAAGQQGTHMRLNQAGSSDNPQLFGPPAPNLATSPAKKKAAVKALGGPDGIEHDTKKAGDSADLTTEKAAKEFKDWSTGAGLTTALKGWQASLKTLRHRLAAEKSALSDTHKALSGTDQRNGELFAQRPTTGDPSAGPLYRSRISDY
ncbi:hypothetical protein SSOG_02548 [Streptomyces himastatinicus ATCC 53653]|uniref:Uncharacterized protein n=1 Tax=Streptomyces himastatinicus ATCC 53653 TaxID=457427 RepID=D9WB57_9ACTN|nr:hypothetical protein [Streptomyces himastatinicus]EFL22834.1 hypothetical protein SSOG_02548 [Streptomyces himastatinicus ATCC 53653]